MRVSVRVSVSRMCVTVCRRRARGVHVWPLMVVIVVRVAAISLLSSTQICMHTQMSGPIKSFIRSSDIPALRPSHANAYRHSQRV